MSVVEWLFDGAVAAAMLVLAWRVLNARSLFEGVVVFMVFGLMMSLAWARLAAPDVALAEAAVGAGITGVFLLFVHRRMRGGKGMQEEDVEEGEGLRLIFLFPLVVALAGLALGLSWVAVELPREPGGLTRAAAAELERAEVAHPVTAVLLNFRSYDTFLEIGVLLAAVAGASALRKRSDLAGDEPPGEGRFVLGWLMRWLGPVMVLCAGYLLWLGKFAAGGAFQAGVVLGGTGILLWMGGQRLLANWPEWFWRGALLLGFGTFLAVGIGVVLAGGGLWEYPRGWAGSLIVIIETAAAVSIGVTFTALFVILQGEKKGEAEDEADGGKEGGKG